MLQHICYSYVFICYTDLDVICRQELVISHVVLLHPHKRCIMICLGIAVPVRATDPDFYNIFPELRQISLQFLIIPLFLAFPVSTSGDKVLFINMADGSISVQDRFQFIRCILCFRLNLQPGVRQRIIHFREQHCDLRKQTVPGFFCCLLPDPGVLVCICFKLGAIYIQML